MADVLFYIPTDTKATSEFRLKKSTKLDLLPSKSRTNERTSFFFLCEYVLLCHDAWVYDDNTVQIIKKKRIKQLWASSLHQNRRKQIDFWKAKGPFLITVVYFRRSGCFKKKKTWKLFDTASEKTHFYYTGMRNTLSPWVLFMLFCQTSI